jgi:hypothetical protein
VRASPCHQRRARPRERPAYGLLGAQVDRRRQPPCSGIGCGDRARRARPPSGRAPPPARAPRRARARRSRRVRLRDCAPTASPTAPRQRPPVSRQGALTRVAAGRVAPPTATPVGGYRARSSARQTHQRAWPRSAGRAASSRTPGTPPARRRRPRHRRRPARSRTLERGGREPPAPTAVDRRQPTRPRTDRSASEERSRPELLPRRRRGAQGRDDRTAARALQVCAGDEVFSLSREAIAPGGHQLRAAAVTLQVWLRPPDRAREPHARHLAGAGQVTHGDPRRRFRAPAPSRARDPLRPPASRHRRARARAG